MQDPSGAYLAMLEQTIYLKMVEIAEQYPESHRRQYLEATAKFALPYCEFTTVSVPNGIHQSKMCSRGSYTTSSTSQQSIRLSDLQVRSAHSDDDPEGHGENTRTPERLHSC